MDTRQSKPLTAIQSRIHEILIRRFNGSQTAMARQLGCSQASISQIVNGHRAPGAGLLNTVASLPGIPLDWLQRGVGCLPEGQSLRDPGHCHMPLYETLGAAFPSETRRVAAVYAINVRAAEYSDTRIVLRLSEDREWSDVRVSGLSPGDHLVFETEQRNWMTQPRILEKRFCVFRSSSGEATERVDLAYVDHIEYSLGTATGSALVKKLRCARLPTMQLPNQDAVGPTALADAFVAAYGRPPRPISSHTESQLQWAREPVRPRMLRRQLAPIFIDAIVGSVVAMFRIV